MSDLNSMNRELKKQQLRQQIVSNQTAAGSRTLGIDNQRPNGEEEVKAVKKALPLNRTDI